MRNNGVNGFPDPDRVGPADHRRGRERLVYRHQQRDVQPGDERVQGLQPPGFTGAKVTPSQRTARLAFAQCVRDHGVPDFPDPAPNGPLIDTNRIPSANTPTGMSALNAATHKCGNFAVPAGVTGGR